MHSSQRISSIDARRPFKGLVNADGSPLRVRKKVRLTAAYDVLTRRGDDDNWVNAVRLNDNAINDRARLQQLRDLARSEKRNNPHMAGLIHKIGNEVVGTGPRLSIEPLTSNDRSERAARRVQDLWRQWTVASGLTAKLWLMLEERITAGETFAVARSNRALTVPVDLNVYEGEQCRSPSEDYYMYMETRRTNNDGYVDGINFDGSGNVASYTFLTHHPYGDNQGTNLDDYRDIDADLVYHWFRKDRPSQYRGVPEVTAMLEVYSRLRRFIESKVKQEEMRAKLLGALKMKFPPDECMDMGMDPVDMLIGDGQFTTLPDGWETELFSLDVTGEGVQAFVRTMLSWATQALLVPWNIVAGDSSDYNFASGRLDYSLFYHYVKIQRQMMEDQLLDWFFRTHWFPMARLAREIPGDLGLFRTVWRWDRREPIDEAKQAQADKTLKEAGLLDEVGYWDDRGSDAYDIQERQIRFELSREKMRQEISSEMGVSLPEQQPKVQQELFNDQQKEQA